MTLIDVGYIALAFIGAIFIYRLIGLCYLISHKQWISSRALRANAASEKIENTGIGATGITPGGASYVQTTHAGGIAVGDNTIGGQYIKRRKRKKHGK